MFKRTLSESSTGSEGETEVQHGVNGTPYFKIPRREHPAPTSPVFRSRNPTYYPYQDYTVSDNSRHTGAAPSQVPKYERRESQASTASTTTSRSSMSETDEDYADGQKLSTVRIEFQIHFHRPVVG